MTWALEMLPSGLGSDPISVAIAIPFLVLAAILLVVALGELALLLLAWPMALLLRAMKVMGWRVVVVNTANPLGSEKTGEMVLRRARVSTTVLEVETMAGGERLRDAIAEYVRRGGDVMDLVVGQWLAVERGKLVSRETKPEKPVKPKAEPA